MITLIYKLINNLIYLLFFCINRSCLLFSVLNSIVRLCVLKFYN